MAQALKPQVRHLTRAHDRHAWLWSDPPRNRRDTGLRCHQALADHDRGNGYHDRCQSDGSQPAPIAHDATVRK